MSHHIHGLVLHKTLLPAAKKLIPGGKGAALEQDFCFIPITDRVFEDLRSTYPELADAENEFERLSAAVEFVAKELSLEGEVAYIETEYWGGPGMQAAIVWKGGEVVLSLSAKAPKVGPINKALAVLGVDLRGRLDEFDTLGLGRYRSSHAWFHEATEVNGAG
jgi:hypothetical protein